MFVFGTSVSGRKDQNNEEKASKRKGRIECTYSATNTQQIGSVHSGSAQRKRKRQLNPSGEHMTKLEKEEQELLKKLEATRERIRKQVEKESTTKAASKDGVRFSSQGGLAFFKALVPDQKLNSGASAPSTGGITGGSKNPSSSTTSSHMLPILTKGAQPAFEAGLMSQANAPSGHVIPIFELPPVSSKAKIINPLPREPTDEEKKRLFEEAKAREHAQRLLGLTEEEVKFFDEVLHTRGASPQNGQSRVGSRDHLSNNKRLSSGFSSDDDLHSPNAQHSTSDVHEFTNSNATYDDGEVEVGKLERKRESKDGVFYLPVGSFGGNGRGSSQKKKKKKGNGSRKERERKEVSRESLRKELAYSIKNVQFLTDTMQQELAQLQKEYPLSSMKGKDFIKRWGATKLAAVFKRREKRKFEQSFRQWVVYKDNENLLIKQRKYLQMQGAAKLLGIEKEHFAKRLRMAFRTWHRIFRFEKDNAEFLSWSRAALKIQKVMRGFKGRKIAKARRDQLEYEEKSKAAIRIQTVFRGKKAKDSVTSLQEMQLLNRAAIRIQNNYRSRMARKTLEKKQQRRIIENKAALRIQTRWRCKKGQMSFHLLRQARRDAAASRLQAIQRRRAAQKRTDRIRVQKRRNRAAVCIQRHYRSRIARRKMAERRKAVESQRRREEQVALKLQAIYRGHRGRIIYALKKQTKYAKMEFESQQITKIQAVFRGKVGRKKGNNRRKEYLSEMCSWARVWIETFDDASQQWIFLNLYTQERLLEPPPDGYTKRDGFLALLDGRVIEDPIVTEKREFEKTLQQCIECEEVAATRRCHECEDVYCDDCYDSIHMKGRLATHSFEWFQNGKPASEAQGISMDLNAVSSSFGGTLGTDTSAEVQQPAMDENWMELYDADNHLPYWYNTVTQETQWENPHQQSAVTSTEEEWEQHYDENGSAYYLGRISRMSVWELPAGAKLANTAQSDWVEYFDDNGTPYYHNSVTGEISWTLG